jgi:hypothetical protein
MSRERITSREADSTGILAAISGLEKSIEAADDTDLVKWADELAKEEKQVVNKSRPAGPAQLKDNGDQNAKANKNWPVSEADKLKVAKKLVALAKDLLAD